MLQHHVTSNDGTDHWQQDEKYHLLLTDGKAIVVIDDDDVGYSGAFSRRIFISC